MSDFDSFGQSALGEFKESAFGDRKKGEPPRLYLSDFLIYSPSFLSHIIELDVLDFSLISSVVAPFGSQSELIGGGNGKDFAYFSDQNPDPDRYLFKCDIDTLAILVQIIMPTANYCGIGGSADVVWTCDHSAGVIDELNPNDLTVIRSGSVAAGSRGCGGSVETIYLSNNITDLNYELNPDDFSVIRSAATFAAYPTGIGGDADTIYHCDNGPLNTSFDVGTVYELSTADLSALRSSALGTNVRRPNGCGG